MTRWWAMVVFFVCGSLGSECGPRHYEESRVFLLLSRHRSGSELLEGLLSENDCVTASGELFDDGAYWTARRTREGLMLLIEEELVGELDDDELPEPFLNFSLTSKRSWGASGFSWMLDQGVQAHAHWLAGAAARRGTKLVLLRRRNHLRQLVANRAVQAYWNNVTGGGRHHRLPVANAASVGVARARAIAVEAVPLPTGPKLLKTMQAAEDEYDELQSLLDHASRDCPKAPVLTIFYEDLCDAPDRTLDTLFTFLLDGATSRCHASKLHRHITPAQGAMLCSEPSSNLNSGTFQIHGRPISEYVTNWPEVEETLTGTKWAGFLERP